MELECIAIGLDLEKRKLRPRRHLLECIAISPDL